MGMNKLLQAINDTVERGAPHSNPPNVPSRLLELRPRSASCRHNAARVHLTSRSLDCDATHTGADVALTSVSNTMDKHLASPTVSDLDQGVLSVANSAVRVGLL